MPAPSEGTFHGRRVVHGIETVRFGYFWPRSLERLTRGGGGIPENISESLLARLQLFPMMFAFLCVSLLEARRSDLIYANWLGAGIVGAAVSLLTGKPLVVSFRGDDGYLARDRLTWWVLTKMVSERASVIAPVSGELLEILVEFGVSREKCKLPRFGVDRKMFHPRGQPDEPRDGVRLLFVGSLIPRKGLQDLLKALSHESFDRVVLVVVGEGFYHPELTEMCERLGLLDRVQWKGVLPPEEVARLMRSSDLLCLPSYMEGRPNVVNEAMASGIPVVATRVGGIPDMMSEGETGLLFDPGDVEELRTCLDTLVSEPDVRKRMGEAGHEFLIRGGVSWDTTAEDFDMIFSGLWEDEQNSFPDSG
ncbi:MAG: glycosyltransferase [Deltaproteobacteria bacterium]